jgi:hypothetical protein
VSLAEEDELRAPARSALETAGFLIIPDALSPAQLDEGRTVITPRPASSPAELSFNYVERIVI